ncbi:MAG TPA: hypothetical protein VJJ46_13910, partial [Anaerolineales bacterium]|nr:hypothetical protein [Anaerolineales bacterium]
PGPPGLWLRSTPRPRGAWLEGKLDGRIGLPVRGAVHGSLLRPGHHVGSIEAAPVGVIVGKTYFEAGFVRTGRMREAAHRSARGPGHSIREVDRCMPGEEILGGRGR